MFISANSQSLNCAHCDFGADSEDNTPDDVYLEASGNGHSYGEDATFECSSQSCSD